MPVLEPFTGHVVAAAHAADVVAPPFDTLTEDERREKRSHPDSFLGVLPPRPETGEVLEHCRANLERLLATGRFGPLEGPVLGVLRIDDGRRTVTGVIGDVAASAFSDGTVLPHEQVRPATVAALRRHLEVVGAVSSPVCVAHAPDPRVAELISRVVCEPPRVGLTDGAGSLRLWVVGDPARRDALAGAVGATRDWLLADGHHRAEAAVPWGRVLCVLAPEDELEVRPFHRRARVDDPDGAARALTDLGLEVVALDAPAAPRGAGEVTLAGGGRWWRVGLAAIDPTASAVDRLDAVRAESDVLGPLLGTPGAAGPDGRRVEAVPPTSDLASLPRPGTVSVVLHPPTWGEIRGVAAAGRTMPPKSTYVVPKQRSGVVVVPREVRLG